MALREQDLLQDFTALGLETGMNLIVHSSLSAMAWVDGGPRTVVSALIKCIGNDGNLAMPAATPQCAEAASFFDIDRTETPLGAIAETFRTWPGTLRSQHPLESVCARGPRAEYITGHHPMGFSEGPGSPFDRMHQLDSWILLLGVGFNRCTALHYAESLVAKRRTMMVRFPVLQDDKTVWHEVMNVADDNDRLFPKIGVQFSETQMTKTGLIGQADCYLFRMQDLVSFAKPCFEKML